ncbi:thymidine kinase [Aeromonas phage ZPAH34]|uniref:thymidine kinase n=1 Tax=Aeromonas phage ZPAH34 TaxID=2924888 RepID=UPI0023291CEF|nr:thymidine kinase [Aeromonas phage ZPAH34]UOX39503.1 thymidine kinase [Aeromonas phage ZPAH34]
MPKKIYFNFGPMNSSKTATLIMNHFNYREQAQNPVILKPVLDNRDGAEPLVKCRAGLSASAILFEEKDNLFLLAASLAGATDRHFDVRVARFMREMHEENPATEHEQLVDFGKSFDKRVDCFLIDEVQFLTEQQAKQLTDIVDYLDIPVLAFGLRNDFQGNPFPASAFLMANAEELKESKGICHCKRKATHVLRVDSNGKVIREGDQICVGGNDLYHSVCRWHWKAGIYK